MKIPMKRDTVKISDNCSYLSFLGFALGSTISIELSHKIDRYSLADNESATLKTPAIKLTVKTPMLRMQRISDTLLYALHGTGKLVLREVDISGKQIVGT